MTAPEKMTLLQALCCADAALTKRISADVLPERYTEAAAVLRSFRERGLPFYEAALAFVVQMKVVRALTTERE